MYQNYFGLNEQAFSIAVNPRYLYMSRQHKEALAHLLYGVKEGGFVMLTGEVGTGKTTIIRCLLEQLPENTEIAIILNPMANIIELLCTICDEYGIQYDPDTATVKGITDLLHQRLLENHTNGKNTVLLIDEAQLLSPEVLEQVRLLTNLETAMQKLLQIVLVGQPELNDLLAQPRLRQLSQRITARFHLTPLTVDETQHYIQHRLCVAGMPENKSPFSPKIVKQIHRFTGGIPRMINIVCERTLVGAYGHSQSEVDSKIFELAKKEVEGNRQSNLATQVQHPYFIYSTMAASGIVGLAIIFLLLQLIFGSEKPVNNTINAPLDLGHPDLGQAPAQPQPIQREQDSPQQIVLLSESQKENANSSSSSFSNYDIQKNVLAQAVLFEYLKLDIDTDTHPCWQINDHGLQCTKAKFDTWKQVSSLNRPVVLSLINSNKFRSHAVLIGMQDKHALLLDNNRKRHTVLLDELGPLWTGDIFYAWKKPQQYSEPLSIGDTSPIVAEIAAQFALLDAQPSPLTTRRFNRALKERVKIFQREHDLSADGILGEQTLMKLNEALGLSQTLEKNFL